MKSPKIGAQRIDRVDLFVFLLSLYLFYAAQVFSSFTLILIKEHFFPSVKMGLRSKVLVFECLSFRNTQRWISRVNVS